MKRFILLPILFLMSCGNAVDLSSENICPTQVNSITIPFNPMLKPGEFPFNISNNIGLDPETLQHVADFWNNGAGSIVINTTSANLPRIEFKQIPELAGQEVSFIALSDHDRITKVCTISFVRKELLTEKVIEHEVGHCLGFMHSSLPAYDCCIMGGIALDNTDNQYDCDLSQLGNYLRRP